MCSRTNAASAVLATWLTTLPLAALVGGRVQAQAGWLRFMIP